MAKDTDVRRKNGGTVILRIAGSIIAALVIGSIGGLLVLWRTSVTATDVSKQIQTESPYIEDKRLIEKAVTEEIPAIKTKMDEIHTEQIQQRVILDRIDRSIDGRVP